MLSGTAGYFAETSKQTAEEIKQNLKRSVGKFKDFLNDFRKK